MVSRDPFITWKKQKTQTNQSACGVHSASVKKPIPAVAIPRRCMRSFAQRALTPPRVNLGAGRHEGRSLDLCAVTKTVSTAAVLEWSCSKRKSSLLAYSGT